MLERGSADWSAFATLAVIGVDDSARKKGQRDSVVRVTTRTAHGAIRRRAVVPDRTKAPVLAFFHRIPDRLRRTVTDVGTDQFREELMAIFATNDTPDEARDQVRQWIERVRKSE